jgi:uncharacterized membrane protein YgaE (UPF0421/DUF939 family)
MINKQKNNIKAVAAGATGAAIGFGIAALGAVAIFGNKKNNDKVKKILATIKNQARNYLEEVQKKTNKKEKEVAEKLADSKNEEAKIIN